MQLHRLEAAVQDIDALDLRIAERLEPSGVSARSLDEDPRRRLAGRRGFDRGDWRRYEWFLSAYHLAAWAGVCPGNHESAGKQKSGRARKGNVHLRTILAGAATSAGRTKGSYLKDRYHRLKARRGAMRAPRNRP